MPEQTAYQHAPALIGALLLIAMGVLAVCGTRISRTVQRRRRTTFINQHTGEL